MLREPGPPPLSCSCENILAKLHSCHSFRWKSESAFSQTWAWKLGRISQAEGFIKQTCFSVLQENSWSLIALQRLVPQFKGWLWNPKPSQADRLVWLQTKGTIYTCEITAVRSQYLSVLVCTWSCTALHVLIPACLNAIFSFIGSTRRRNELSHCTNSPAEPGPPHPQHLVSAPSLWPPGKPPALPGECWKRVLAAGHFSITPANRFNAPEEVVQNFLGMCCNEALSQLWLLWQNNREAMKPSPYFPGGWNRNHALQISQVGFLNTKQSILEPCLWLM